jgi:hypothetical protein
MVKTLENIGSFDYMGLWPLTKNASFTDATGVRIPVGTPLNQVVTGSQKAP